jgi:MerR family transcriptional regulator, light-induced transcriptional regulator
LSRLAEGPLFNLKAVVRQTGLKPDTLRAWERRYGLPAPRRSVGKHRLYSQRDIDTVRWLMARQAEGLSIKQAVQLWRQIENEGLDPLQRPSPLAGPVTSVLRPETGSTTLAGLRESWIDACLDYDEPRAEQVLAQAFALHAPEAVCLELLQPAISEIGMRWYRGEVTVQQEHFASELAVRRLEALMAAAPLPVRPGKILVAAPPREHHVLGLLVLTFLLKRQGWAVIYLGANVPAERLEATLVATRPQLAILAAQQLHSAATLLEVAAVLQRQGVPMAYGGLVFNRVPDVRSRIPGHFLGERVDVAVQAVERLMVAPQPVLQVDGPPEHLRLAREHYADRLGLIEARVARALHGTEMEAGHMALANREMALNIKAGLALGDISLVGTDIEWVEELLSNHRMPTTMLKGYLDAYQLVARQELDERGGPVVDWLRGLLGENLEEKGKEP